MCTFKVFLEHDHVETKGKTLRSFVQQSQIKTATQSQV